MSQKYWLIIILAVYIYCRVHVSQYLVHHILF